MRTHLLFSTFILVLLTAFVFFKNEKGAVINYGKKTDSPFYLGGIQVNEVNLDNWVQTLNRVGMNTVEVTVYINQGNWDGDNTWWSENEKWVIEEIRAAKKEGLNVVLILRTSLHDAYPRNKFLWHGMILPKSNALIRNWFFNYKKFALKWAEICQQEGVEIMSIGSEMNAMTATRPIENMPPLYQYFNSFEKQKKQEDRALKYENILRKNDLWVRGEGGYDNLQIYIADKIKAQINWANQVTFKGQSDRIGKMNARRKSIEKQWVGIISDIRKIYGGQLTYAANFDNYKEVGFWKYLDFIGINAYFKLRGPLSNNLPDNEMKNLFKNNWTNIFNEIKEFQKTNSISDKPILFTELGYVRAADSTLEPWQGFGFSIVGSGMSERIILWKDHPLKPIERTLAVEALNEAVKANDFDLAGILYWKLTTHPKQLDVEPFALHISEKPTDGLQNALVGFCEK
ncbi:MAG TPA: hypothetical protein ENJ95_20805 [Bacteroidetes bacterium]|nr:hypothetical protein [Bacteroidota bacterium]